MKIKQNKFQPNVLPVQRNVQLLKADRFLNGFCELGMLAVIYYQSIAHSYLTAMLIFSMIELTRALVEIPTGVISDMLPRKKVLISAATFNWAYILLLLLAAFFQETCYLFVGAVALGLSSSLYSGTIEAFLYEAAQSQNKHKEFDLFLSQTEAFKQAGLMTGAGIAAFVIKFFSWEVFICIMLFISSIQIVVNFCFDNVCLLPKKTCQSVLKQFKGIGVLFWKNVRLRRISIAHVYDDSLGRVFRDIQGSYFELLIPVWMISLGKIVRQFCGMISFYCFRYVRRIGLLNVIIVSSWGEISTRFVGVLMNNIMTPWLMFSNTLFMGTKEVAQRTALQHEFNNNLRASSGSFVSIFRSLTTALLFYLIGFLSDIFSIRIILSILVLLQFISVLNYYRIRKIQSAK